MICWCGGSPLFIACGLMLIAGPCRKTTGALKIIHERYDSKKNSGMGEHYKVCACVRVVVVGMTGWLADG